MTITTLSDLLDKMWKDYTAMNPQAQKIHDLFVEKGETIQNDHIALRTFNHPKVNIDVLAEPFVKSGYVEKGQYEFPEKKLFAKHYEHSDKTLPKIFISELKLEEFDQELQDTINKLIDQMPKDLPKQFDFCSLGRPWELSFLEYESLRLKSEYASWVAAHGYRPNHFTVLVNRLKNFDTLRQVNEFIKMSGFDMNSSGGEIKGSIEVCLEQSSTKADVVKVPFTDGSYETPACYYEFALRYPLPNGELYQGFVAKSADKIFESTDKG